MGSYHPSIRYVTRWDAIGIALALMSFLFAITERDWAWLIAGTLVGASVGFRIWSRRLRDNHPGGGGLPPPAV